MTLPWRGPSAAGAAAPGRRHVALDVALLTLLVVVVYFVRIDRLPPVGEEGRRALGAISMIDSGDWVVLQIGGVAFPDRPPMTNWLIAIAGLARGEVDTIAIRLPSVLAVLATTLMLYLCCVRLDSRVVALTSGAAYATFGQVMQIGRLGESDAVFAFFVASALLLWHLGFARGWPPLWAWMLGYSLLALGALVKGLQAPVYFGAATGAFLLLHRRWRWLFGWGQWLGLAWFLLLVALWQVPYYRAAGLEASIDTWFALVKARSVGDGLLTHVVAYPFETLGCLLPWSLLLFALIHPGVRRGLSAGHPQLSFVLTALAVTYPTVWFSALAEARYYLVLYPCLAVLVGILVDHLANAASGSPGARARHLALRSASAFALLSLVVLGLAQAIDRDWATALRPSIAWSVLLVLVATATLIVVRRAESDPSPGATRAAVLVVAALFGTFHTTFWLNSRASRRQDVRPLVAALRARVPEPEKLLSLGPVDARFAYPYRHLIQEVPWPDTLAEVRPDLDYFCFDVRPTDTAASRYAERGMQDQWTTPGTLPFAWEEVGRVGVGAKVETPPSVAVVIGRALRTADGELIAGGI